jgi:hypothetical protein
MKGQFFEGEESSHVKVRLRPAVFLTCMMFHFDKFFSKWIRIAEEARERV